MRTKQRNNLAETACHERVAQNTDVYAVKARNYKGLRRGSPVFTTEWLARTTKQLDYWVTAGDTPAEIEEHFADAIGKVPMMPEYGLGFWQCKLRYYNQEQVLNVAREYKKRGIPLDRCV